MYEENTISPINKAKGDVFKILTVFLIIVSVFFVFKTIGEYKTNKYIGEGSTMSFTGEGEVFSVADVVTFSFSVSEEAKTPVEAQKMATEKGNTAINFLKENGIAEKDIKTINYSLNPKYEWRRNSNCLYIECPRDNRVLVGYEVNQSISVKVRETEKAGEILAGIGDTGVSNISGLNFEIDDEDSLKREARKLAIEDAKSKAEQLAQDLDVKLVRIVSFNESGAYPYYSKAVMMEDSMAGYGIGGGMAPEIPMGENKISSNVTITYEIR